MILVKDAISNFWSEKTETYRGEIQSKDVQRDADESCDVSNHHGDADAVVLMVDSKYGTTSRRHHWPRMHLASRIARVRADLESDPMALG